MILATFARPPGAEPAGVLSLAASTATALLIGLVPALQLSGSHLAENLKEGARSSGGRAGRMARNLMAVSEIALATVLLISAGMLLQSFLRLRQVDPGFRPGGVLTAAVRYTPPPGDEGDRAMIFYGRLLEQIGALPGVEAAGLVSNLPLTPGNRQRTIGVDGHPSAEDDQSRITVDVAVASGEYFPALGVALQEGRWFDGLLTDSDPTAAVIDEMLARRVWPNGGAVGGRFRFDDEPWHTVVGVVGHVRRAREIGVRMALGARRADILRLVLGQGLKLTAVGLALGAGGAFVVGSYLESVLFEIRAAEPLIFAGVAVLLGAVSLLACGLPARRAMAVDPLTALRCG